MKVRSVRKNAFLNTAKQVCQVLFPIITIPYVTRILGAANYGKINFSNSIVNYFVLLSSLGVTSYAIREGALFRDDKKKFREFSSEIFSINIVSTIIAYFLLFVLLFVPQISSYKSLILVQSLSIILTTLGVDWVNSVYEDYFYIAVRYILFQVISILLLFLFVRKSSDYLKYAAIIVLATTGGNLLNIFYIRRYTKLKLVFHFNWKKHLIPILVLFGNQVAVTLYVNSDVTMLGFLSSESTVGLYSLASKIYTVIQQMLNALLIVSVPRLAYYLGNNNSKKFNILAQSIQKSLLLIIIPLMTGLFSFADTIMKLAGGTQYLQGSNALRILSLALFFSLISAFYTNCILLPYKLENKILLITSAAAVANILLNVWLIPVGGATGAAMTTLISEVIVASWSHKIASKYLVTQKRLPRDATSLLVGGICIIAICFVSKKIFCNSMISVVIAVIISAIVYLLILILFKNSIIMDEMEKCRKW